MMTDKLPEYSGPNPPGIWTHWFAVLWVLLVFGALYFFMGIYVLWIVGFAAVILGVGLLSRRGN
jgi:hypothetical protein